jgi:DNA invertase Pin-like site-specific DNA recombinase
MMNSVNNGAVVVPAGMVTPLLLQRLAIVYVRQSTPTQTLDHVGSPAAQRDLVNVARGLGWPDSRIRVIDSDLGLPGASTWRRKGYLELLEQMESDGVGIVLVQDLTRLSRRSTAIASFLELAEEKGVLIYANGAIQDPASGDIG